MTTKKRIEETKIEFEVDTGKHTVTNLKQAEDLIKSARKWLDEHKDMANPQAKFGFISVCKLLGFWKSSKNSSAGSPTIDNSHNLSWKFSPSNPNAPFRELALKYRVYVGRHNGIAKDPAIQSVSFRQMTITDIPEGDKETREKFGQV